MRWFPKRQHIDAVVDEVSLTSRLRIYAHLYRTAGEAERRIIDNRVAELIDEIEGTQANRDLYQKQYEAERQ